MTSSETAPRRKQNFRTCHEWMELPNDVTASILYRLGPVEILNSAQLVCSKWYEICKDPLMWRTIDIGELDESDLESDFESDMMGDDDDDDDDQMDAGPPKAPLLPEHMEPNMEKMCRHAIDRSSGNLVDLTVSDFATNELLMYIAHSSSGIKRLGLVDCDGITDLAFIQVVSKLPLLEDLDLTLCSKLSHESVAAVGRSCPLLKSFKLNRYWVECKEEKFDGSSEAEHGGRFIDDSYALAIARTMPGLHHLQIFGNQLTNDGLRAILDCCPYLESLDLRYCFYLSLGGNLGNRCAERIKKLLRPGDSTADYEFGKKTVVYSDNDDIDSDEYEENSHEDSDEDFYDDDDYDDDDDDSDMEETDEDDSDMEETDEDA